MGLEKFQVIFDNPHAVYYAGQNVSGRIILVANTPKKVRGINIRIMGKAEVEWSEDRTQTSGSTNTTMQNVTDNPLIHADTSTTEKYTSEEVYFENKFAVLGGGNDQTIPAGDHFYPFNYVLPMNIPSSFEGEHGHVRYTVRAVVDRPWKFDHEVKGTFTVINPLDLNADPELVKPVNKNKQRTFCCLCCASGPVTINLSLPYGGAVSGETLIPTLDIENNSRVYMSLITLKLVKAVSFKARGSTKAITVTISEKNLGYVDAGQSKTFEREALPIPPLPPSNLNNCGIIDLSYHLEAHFAVSSFYRNFSVKLPVVLGTIPFHQNFANYSPAPQNPPLGWNFSPSAPQRDGSPNYPDLPPPTFEESMFGPKSTVERNDSQYVFGDKNFAPRYPVYHMPQYPPQYPPQY